MSEDAWDVVVHGVAIHQQTLQVRNITIGWRGGDDACVMIFKEEVGQATHSHGITNVDIATEFVFGPDGNGGGETPQPQPVRDPVNIDGTPRNTLHDRLRRGCGAGNIAAIWVAMVLATVGLHT